jgi:hypothetical protein
MTRFHRRQAVLNLKLYGLTEAGTFMHGEILYGPIYSAELQYAALDQTIHSALLYRDRNVSASLHMIALDHSFEKLSVIMTQNQGGSVIP